MAAQETKAYYERTQWLYNLLWSKRALSYGLWEDGTKTVTEAIEHQYQYLRSALNVTRDDHLLDLGCGTGGAAIRLAQLTGCRVTGITLSAKQIRQANQMAKWAGVEQLVSFQKVNFEQRLPYDNGVFTKAYSVEALCYAVDKRAVVQEVSRVLAPSGLFICLDGYLTSESVPLHHQRSYRLCLAGWRVPNLAEKKQFNQALNQVGFRSIQWQNKTSQVMPSSKQIRKIGLTLWPVTRILSLLRLIPYNLHENTVTMIEQAKAFTSYAEYAVVLAGK